jgi:hypothetical protein
MSEKKFALTFLALYAILILTSLGDPAMTLSIGRLFMGSNVDLFFSLVPYGIVSILLAYLTFVAKETRARRFLFLMIMSVVLFFIVRYLNGEREKMHLTEFAFLGALIFWSATVWGSKRRTAYLFVAAAGSITVGLDELIQTSLSLKLFSMRDILINSMAVALGAVLYGGLFLNSTKEAEEAEASP